MKLPDTLKLINSVDYVMFKSTSYRAWNMAPATLASVPCSINS